MLLLPRISRDPCGATDDGFTLVEVIVAFALFMIFATAVLTILGAGINVSRDDSARLTATNLASRELEVTRDVFSSPAQGPDRVVVNDVMNPSPLPGGVVGQPLVVNNVPFTVVRSAQWASIGGPASTCDDGSNAELGTLRVSVKVSWPTLGSRPPVTMSTTMTPPKGTYSELNGHIAIKVIDSLGNPRGGVTVSASGPTPKSGVTGSDGCVLLRSVGPGSYRVELTGAGYVSPAGDATASATVQVQSGQLVRKSIDYDRAATINATFITAPGFGLPAVNSVPVTLSNSGIQPSGSRSIAATSLGGNVRNLDNLWPFPSGYQLWSGACPDNDPEYAGVGSGGSTGSGTSAGGSGPVGGSAAPSGTGSRQPATATTPGGSSVADIVLAPLTVTGPVGATVVARQEAGVNGCVAGARVVLGPLVGGTLKASLPYGTWLLSKNTSSTTSSPNNAVSVRLSPPVRNPDGTTTTSTAPTVNIS